MQNLEARYLKVATSTLGTLDDFLVEDIDLISKYLVLRFLKTSPMVQESTSEEDRMESLKDYLKMVYPFLVTFVMSVNSLPFGETRA